jgi:hypothetical protein
MSTTSTGADVGAAIIDTAHGAGIVAASPLRKPSGRQMFAICHALLEIAGIPSPETAADASAILERVRAERDSLRAAAASSGGDPDGMPF